jgi:hypothetical protein
MRAQPCIRIFDWLASAQRAEALARYAPRAYRRVFSFTSGSAAATFCALSRQVATPGGEPS